MPEIAVGFGFILINNGTNPYSKMINRNDIIYLDGDIFQFSLENAQDVNITQQMIDFEEPPHGTTVSNYRIIKITFTNTKIE